MGDSGLCLCRLTSCALATRNSLHAPLFQFQAPGDPHSCARTLPGSTDRASRSSIRPSQLAVRPIGGQLLLLANLVWSKVSAQTHLLGRHLRRHWRPSGKLPVLLRPSYTLFLAVRAALPFEHPSPSSPFFETVPQTPGGGRKREKRSRGVVHGSYNAMHTTGCLARQSACYIRNRV